MKGRIKMYNEEKGFGFILGDDMKDYFFHISEVKAVNIPKRGQYVEYSNAVGDKGPVAKEIFLGEVSQNQPAKPVFLQIGNTRLRTKYISQFGISADNRYYVKVYEHTQGPSITLTGSLLGALADKLVWNGLWEEINEHDYMCIMKQFHEAGQTQFRRYIKSFDGGIHQTSREVHIKESDLKVEKRKYLYVTLRNGDNFQFFEDQVSFDLREKEKELEALLAR